MRRRAGGFTLLEAMIAVAIIATTVFTLLFIRNRAVDHTGMASEARIMWTLLQQKVGDFDEVKIDDYKDGNSESGDFPEAPLEGVRWERTMELKEMTMIDKLDDDHPRKMWLITVKIIYPRPDGVERRVQTQFYRLQKEDDTSTEPPK